MHSWSLQSQWRMVYRTVDLSLLVVASSRIANEGLGGASIEVVVDAGT
jgi:hypothetical protein